MQRTPSASAGFDLAKLGALVKPYRGDVSRSSRWDERQRCAPQPRARHAIWCGGVRRLVKPIHTAALDV